MVVQERSENGYGGINLLAKIGMRAQTIEGNLVEGAAVKAETEAEVTAGIELMHKFVHHRYG